MAAISVPYRSRPNGNDADMQKPAANMLPDGRRLHLHHGPIDLVVEAVGDGRTAACQRIRDRFETVLQEMVDELDELRLPASTSRRLEGAIARRMQNAVLPLLPTFITPMAAVAGAVADEMVEIATAANDLDKVIVNNGGDIGFYLGPSRRLTAALAGSAGGRITVSASDPWRGLATSGWQGRSQSFGIADSVSVLANNAATADAAATLIANAVDLPEHPHIERTPASQLSPDSDLGGRMVTTNVGPLSSLETAEALDKGEAYAKILFERSIIGGAVLVLNHEVRCVGAGRRLTNICDDEKASGFQQSLSRSVH